MRDDGTFNPFAPGEPPRDEELAALLRRAVGDVPPVDFDALASRITLALPTRAGLAWWSYAERWSRRILPIALAASLIGALMLWNADASGVMIGQAVASDVVADVVQGAPIEDAASTFAGTMTSGNPLIVAESE